MHVKVSKYTLTIPTGPITYLVNTFSGASIALGEAERQGVAAIFEEVATSGVVREEQSQVVELLIANGFLVPIEVDELVVALDKYDRGRSNLEVMSLTIATTMECNMGCYYCFEDRTSTAKLNGQDVNAIVQFVADRLPKKGRLHVTWFGGEPLLAKDFVLETSRALMQLAANLQAHYSASMVTNGYNLDIATAHELRDHGVKSIQVTLDGQKDHHDTVRRHLEPLSSNRVSPSVPIVDTPQGSKMSRRIASYTQIVENIYHASDALRISVRVNVSKRNSASIKLLIDDLLAAGLVDRLESIYFAPLFNFKVTDPKKNYQPKEEVHFTMRDFAALEAELLEYAFARGFNLRDWANPSYSGCIAVAKNGFVVDSNGEVKKCDHELGEPGTAVSSLRDPTIFNADNERMWDEYRPESNIGCDTCVLLPVCYSHCPHKNMAAETPEQADKCPSHKYNWERTLPLVLAQRASRASQLAANKVNAGAEIIL